MVTHSRLCFILGEESAGECEKTVQDPAGDVATYGAPPEEGLYYETGYAGTEEGATVGYSKSV